MSDDKVNSTINFKVVPLKNDTVNLDSIMNGDVQEMAVSEELRETKTADGYCVECSGPIFLP
jgi:hypothetical protein